MQPQVVSSTPSPTTPEAPARPAQLHPHTHPHTPPHTPPHAPAYALPHALPHALDHIAIAIALLDADMRVIAMNASFRALWSIPTDLANTQPSLAEVAHHAGNTTWASLPTAERQEYLRQRQAQIRAGTVPPTYIELLDGRHLRFCCDSLPDGGRILTYTDISDDLRAGAEAALDQVSAELRFANETLESQAAHLVALAEASDQAAQRAETACRMLEKEVEERRELESRLRAIATKDGLTGVLNRSALIAAGEQALLWCRTNGTGLGVLMLDADHFKTINDRFGHAGGDQTLRWLTTACRGIVRTTDHIGRLGGEEFAIILSGSTLESTARIAERLRVEIAGRAAWLDQTPIFVTVSIGVAVARPTDQSVEQVIMRADAALYRAKNRGRNRIALEIEADGLIQAEQALTAESDSAG